MTSYDITESIPYDLATASPNTTFDLTNTAYDVVINDIPFIASVSNQNPYKRETAQYRKDQFDNSTEPGEQSFTGWWLRSQTSWHNGAGIDFYEPGTDYTHVSHRFHDSRGVDVWTPGEATLLNDVFHSYTGANGIISSVANDGTADIMVTGDSAGALKKVTFNDDSVATATSYTLFTGHNVGTTHPFLSVTTDGARYFAVCSRAIHRGNSSTADKVIYYLGAAQTQATIRFVKGYLMLGFGRSMYLLDPNKAEESQHDNANNSLPTASMTHKSNSWSWNEFVAGNRFVYASGYNNSNSEIWAVPYDDTGATINLDPASAIQVAAMPFGERVNSMYFYLGYLAIGTNKGIRIARVATDGSIVVGPLLFEVDTNVTPVGVPTGVTGFVANDRFIWGATSVAGDNGNDNGILVRVDLSTEFDDGTFPYAYDLQYESDKDSYCSGVHYANNRLHMIINEPTESPAGEIQTQNLSVKRASGWLETGKIRYGTIEPKFFRFINVQCSTGQGDTITVGTIDQNGLEDNLQEISGGFSNQDIYMSNLQTKQENIGLKFTFSNSTLDENLPTLKAYQLKAIPAVRRQRMYQFPLSCYDTEMDRFGSVFGYAGRAIETVNRLEALEEQGNFVTITDYRTNESFVGVVEEVRFTNESSPDKNNSGFGGLLIVTVRKM